MTKALDSYEIKYDVNNRFKDYPQHKIKVHASPDEMETFVRDGFLVRRNFIPPEWIEDFGAALEEIIEEDKGKPKAEVYEGNGLYFRRLLERNETFHRLIKYDPSLTVARALLGPQVSFYVESRVALAGVADAGVAWHYHMAVIPDPLPPFFCYPHTMQGLIYLDEIGDKEGPLSVIPGSHIDNDPRRDYDGTYDTHPDEVQLKFSPGDCILMHGNLWHKTTPTAADCGRRRLVLFGYAPSWLNDNTDHIGSETDSTLIDQLRATDPEVDELIAGRSLFT
ncbi:phytanoyl-CoA dioxygenase family protein [Amycolatopsis sp. lyj-112]|uniref:phytanoyl-CoA dioxygenase family protein n=1 Tax=Amycolatopsis sp. lyj-112 TaxID=2789288 RepID=UPI00397B66FC